MYTHTSFFNVSVTIVVIRRRRFFWLPSERERAPVVCNFVSMGQHRERHKRHATHHRLPHSLTYTHTCAFLSSF